MYILGLADFVFDREFSFYSVFWDENSCLCVCPLLSVLMHSIIHMNKVCIRYMYLGYFALIAFLNCISNNFTICFFALFTFNGLLFPVQELVQQAGTAGI